MGSDTANNHGSKTVTGTSTEVEVDSFYFNPTVITATPGAKIKLELSNEATVLHNFSLDAQSINQDIQPGTKKDVTITVRSPASWSSTASTTRPAGWSVR